MVSLFSDKSEEPSAKKVKLDEDGKKSRKKKKDKKKKVCLSLNFLVAAT